MWFEVGRWRDQHDGWGCVGCWWLGVGWGPGTGCFAPAAVILGSCLPDAGNHTRCSRGRSQHGMRAGLGAGLGCPGRGNAHRYRRASPSFPISLLPFPMNGHVPPPPTRPLAGLPNSGASTHLAVPLHPSSHTAISTGLVLPLRTRSQRRSCWPGRWAPWNRQTRPSKRQSTCSWLSPNGAAWPHP